MKISGNQLVAKSLKSTGAEVLFFLMGYPVIDLISECNKIGIKCIDVRHEQAAGMMAHAWSRLKKKPGICVASSGPATINFATSVTIANEDLSPVICIGGSSPIKQYNKGDFQEIDQVSVFKPITKWSTRVYNTENIPQTINMGFIKTMSNTPGPVYLDFPADILYSEVEEGFEIEKKIKKKTRSFVDPSIIEKTIELLSNAERPIIVAGNGVLWSGGGELLREFIKKTNIPVFTTPETRGVIEEEDKRNYSRARSFAFNNADIVLVLGTRFNFILSFGNRFNNDAKIIKIDINEEELYRNRSCHLGIIGDIKDVLKQLLSLTDNVNWNFITNWCQILDEINKKKTMKDKEFINNVLNNQPIHPMFLFNNIAKLMEKDAIVSVDGQETLLYARKEIPTNILGHRLNPGPSGCMGVSIPFGIGAKVACPDKQVIILTGDGSFGMNGFELDTAIRHNIPVNVVISNNGGWTGKKPNESRIGRNLGYTRYDLIAKDLGCHSEFVQKPEELIPALTRSFNSNKPSCVNVITDPNARASTTKFVQYGSVYR